MVKRFAIFLFLLLIKLAASAGGTVIAKPAGLGLQEAKETVNMQAFPPSHTISADTMQAPDDLDDDADDDDSCDESFRLFLTGTETALPEPPAGFQSVLHTDNATSVQRITPLFITNRILRI